jgi:hypothetical protein
MRVIFALSAPLGRTRNFADVHNARWPQKELQKELR